MNELRSLSIEANTLAYQYAQTKDRGVLNRLIEINKQREFLVNQNKKDSSLPPLEVPSNQPIGGTTS